MSVREHLLTLYSCDDDLEICLTMSQDRASRGVLYSLATYEGDLILAGDVSRGPFVDRELTQAMVDRYLKACIDIHRTMLATWGILPNEELHQ